MMLSRLLPVATLLLIPSVALASFVDVETSHPNVDAIHYAQEENLVSGYPDGTFKPDQLINRAEFTKIIMNGYNGLDVVPKQCGSTNGMYLPFSDVHQGDWFAFRVCLAVEASIVVGYPDGTFRPAANINFVEAAKMISVAIDPHDFTVPAYEYGTEWYERFVQYLAVQNAIPLSITRFDQSITRGEMAEMIYRLKGGVTNKGSRTYEELSTGGNFSIAHVKNVAFRYPSDWGPLAQALDREIIHPNDNLVFRDLDRRNRYPIGANEMLEFSTRTYDNRANRYEEVCASKVDMCDSMEQSDMLKQKSDLISKANTSIAGYPATYREWYDPSGAYVLRLYTFFTDTQRIQLQVGYDVGDMYTAEYDRRVQNGGSPSISELVQEDLGRDYPDPYNGLLRLHPAEMAGMKMFFDQVNAMLASME